MVQSFFKFVRAFQHTGSDWMSLVRLLATFGVRRHCKDIRDRIYSMLALSGKQNSLMVDYGITKENLMLQVLSAYEHDLCLCSAAILANALELSEPKNRFGNAYYVEIDVSAPSCGEYYRTCCYDCMWGFPVTWSTHRGLILDMHAICSSMHGHLFADIPERSLAELEDNLPVLSTSGHYGRTDMPTLQLSNIGISQHLCQNQPSRYCPSTVHARWYLTFDTLVRIIRYEYNSTSQVPLCENLGRCVGYFDPERPRLALLARATEGQRLTAGTLLQLPAIPLSVGTGPTKTSGHFSHEQ